MTKRLPLLIAVLALAVWAGNFIIKNFLAVSLLTYGQPGESSAAAVGYAPANPEVLAARARYLLYRADEPRADEAIALLQQATVTSPLDYRYWLELGKAYDSSGQPQKAESALGCAVKLAPRYFEPRWALANSRLRAGKIEAALNDFREAVALSGSLYGSASPRPDRNVTLNAFNAISGALGMSLGALHGVTPSDSAARSYLAVFLATHDALDQALEIWRNLPADDPASYRSLAAQLTRELQSKNRFAEAREVWQKFSIAEGVPAADPNNLIANAGFELTPLRENYAGVVDLGEGFEWTIRRHAEVRAARSTEAAHSGSYGLRLVFTAPMNSAFQEVSTLVAVEPMRQFRLSYFAKTRNLSSLPNETPFVEITDAANPTAFNLHSVAPSGTADWSEQAITFTTTENTRGLRLTVRAPQVRTIDRARIPELWLDDFRLESLGAHASSVRSQ
jgi:tetratricopeptide (TPR) repeat protein